MSFFLPPALLKLLLRRYILSDSTINNHHIFCEASRSFEENSESESQNPKETDSSTVSFAVSYFVLRVSDLTLIELRAGSVLFYV